ncbi:MAG: hypothetical protein JSR85_08960, partial [Proteobacteria bacterium]|nr:hypothetical protein [Pseudomonadota bacterium]
EDARIEAEQEAAEALRLKAEQEAAEHIERPTQPKIAAAAAAAEEMEEALHAESTSSDPFRTPPYTPVRVNPKKALFVEKDEVSASAEGHDEPLEKALASIDEKTLRSRARKPSDHTPISGAKLEGKENSRQTTLLQDEVLSIDPFREESLAEASPLHLRQPNFTERGHDVHVLVAKVEGVSLDDDDTAGFEPIIDASMENNPPDPSVESVVLDTTRLPKPKFNRGEAVPSESEDKGQIVPYKPRDSRPSARLIEPSTPLPPTETPEYVNLSSFKQPRKHIDTIIITEDLLPEATMNRLMTDQTASSSDTYTNTYLSLSRLQETMPAGNNPVQYLIETLEQIIQDSESTYGVDARQVNFDLRHSSAPVATALREVIDRFYSNSEATVRGGTPPTTPIKPAQPSSTYTDSPGNDPISSSPSPATPSSGKYTEIYSPPPAQSPGVYRDISSPPPRAVKGSPGTYGDINSPPPATAKSPGTYGDINSPPPGAVKGSPGAYEDINSPPPRAVKRSPGAYGDIGSPPPGAVKGSPGVYATFSSPLPATAKSPGTYGDINSPPPGAVKGSPGAYEDINSPPPGAVKGSPGAYEDINSPPPATAKSPGTYGDINSPPPGTKSPRRVYSVLSAPPPAPPPSGAEESRTAPPPQANDKKDGKKGCTIQ